MFIMNMFSMVIPPLNLEFEEMVVVGESET
jgi:hypothetical protein